MVAFFFVQQEGLKSLKTPNFHWNDNDSKFLRFGGTYRNVTAGYQVVYNKVNLMLQLSTKEGFLLFLLVCVLGFIVYFVYYPLKIIALFASFFRSQKKAPEDILAVHIIPKIRIEYNGNEKSKFINDMKTMLENLVAENDAIYSIQSAAHETPKESVGLPKDRFIPEDDEMDPDLRIEDDEGPVIREDQAPEDDVVSGEPDNYIELKDLIK